MNQANDIFASEYRARKSKDYLKPEEVYECEKFRIRDSYGMEVTEDLVEKDEGGRLIRAIATYEQQFLEILQTRQQLIDLWVGKQRAANADITLLCYESPQDFCHRHIVGQEVIQKYLPEKWSGEVGLYPKDNGQTVTLININMTSSESTQTTTSKSITLKSSPSPCLTNLQNLSFPPVIVGLLAKCHNCGYAVFSELTSYHKSAFYF